MRGFPGTQPTEERLELFPWATSWYIREIGRCDPCHSMEAAFIRGQQAHTPSWESSRHGIFMKADRSNQGVEEPCAAALALLDADPRAFPERYFMPAVDPRARKGGFSVPSA